MNSSKIMTILIVDDHQNMGRTITDILRNVEEACDAGTVSWG